MIIKSLARATEGGKYFYDYALSEVETQMPAAASCDNLLPQRHDSLGLPLADQDQNHCQASWSQGPRGRQGCAAQGHHADAGRQANDLYPAFLIRPAWQRGIEFLTASFLISTLKIPATEEKQASGKAIIPNESSEICYQHH